MGEKGFAKTDMERVALFSEPGYISINDKYKTTHFKSFNEAADKGKQMLSGGSKEKSGLQHGYFHTKYDRLYEGEAYTDRIKMRRQHRMKEAKKNIGKPFLPSSGIKKPVGLGNHYGTFAGPVNAFSPAQREAAAYKPPGRNFITNPSKKGTGYGYVDVTIGSYGKHLPDEYDRGKELNRKEVEHLKRAMKGHAFKLNMHPADFFDDNPYKSDRPLPAVKSAFSGKRDIKPFRPSNPGKQPGGMKAGTFDPFPSYSSDPYKDRRKSYSADSKIRKVFFPPTGPKSAPQNSIITHNVMREINTSNYRNVSSVVYH